MLTLVQRCAGCDLILSKIVTSSPHHREFCPRCHTEQVQHPENRFNKHLAYAITGLLLFIPLFFLPLITIDLFGVKIPTTLASGAYLLADTFPWVAGLIFFALIIAPMCVFSFILIANWSLKRKAFRIFKTTLNALHTLQHWCMFEVYLISLGIACFKIKDHADIEINTALGLLFLLHALLFLIFRTVHTEQYWEAWQATKPLPSKDREKSQYCTTCGLTQSNQTHCQRCHEPLFVRRPFSVQRTWAYLITASVFVIPANAYAISIFYRNGLRLEDTIYSGVSMLVNSGLWGIALLIFTASILVPIAKIAGLAYLLLSIQWGHHHHQRQKMRLYRFIQSIGKWSMMDLFVIAIMVTLIDRGQLLDFTPGMGATAFGAVVFFTMLAAESLDSRLIWDHYGQ